jgi:cell division control protein 24
MDNGSTESLSDTLVSTITSTAGGSAQTNITREMVETERKYVQDLEIMQVSSQHFKRLI